MTTSNTQRTTKVCGNCALFQADVEGQSAGHCFANPPTVITAPAEYHRRSRNTHIMVRPAVGAEHLACRHWQPLEWRNLEG